MERPEYLKADSLYRRKVIIIIVVIILCGALFLSIFKTLLDNYLAKQSPEFVINLIKYIFLILMIIPASFSVYLLLLAMKTIKQRQFPPQDIKVIKDTRILYDEYAVNRAKILIAIACIILILCFFIVISAFMLVNLFK